MQKAESRAVAGCEGREILPGCFEQREGTDDVGLDEGLRAIDRSIDVRLGRQVDDGVGPRIGEDPDHGAGVRDVGAHEGHARILQRLFQIEQAAGVCQLVDDDKATRCFGERVRDEIGADEAGSACD